MWIRTTSDRATDRISVEKKLTESLVTEGKIVPTLTDKDNRSAEPVGRPQQATLKDTADKYITQFRIFAGCTKVTDDKQLIKYFMEGINAGILQKIFGQNPLSVKQQKSDQTGD